MKQKVYIIAEAGVNHDGLLDNALKLIEIASEAGADAVKFQTFKAKNLVSEFASKADYQIKNTRSSESQYEMLKKYELSLSFHEQLIKHCKKYDVEFLSSPFDEESARLLFELGLRKFKIPSGEITNLPYLKYIGQLKVDVILSTGMANLEEIEAALKILVEAGTQKDNITLLHCNTEYPTPFKDVNLYAMQTIRNKFGLKIGYSDHTLGIEVPVAAVALGACVIEKHFTLDKNMPGPDHKASLEPDELKSMVRAIRNVELALAGDGKKVPSQSELKNLVITRKSIHLAKQIKKGELIKVDHLIMKRPGNGISPMQMDLVIGRKAARDLKENHKLSLQDLLE